MAKKTTIAVDREVLERITEHKIHPRQSINDALRDVFIGGKNPKKVRRKKRKSSWYDV